MIRVLYITRARLSFLRAHAQNILKTAEYLARLSGVTITVFSSAAEPKKKEDIFSEKNIRTSFDLDVAQKRRSLFAAIFRLRNQYDVLYFRDPFLWHSALVARVFLGKKVVFEVHGSHEWRLWRPLWHLALWSSSGVVFITKALRDYYQTKKPHSVVHTNGIERADFDHLPSKVRLREDLSLPQNKTIIMYLGSFLWYSADILKETIANLPANVLLVVVGAKESEKKLFENEIRAGRAMVISRVTPQKVPQYLASADILINPLAISYPGSISSKLYEYLAAGKPIVSSAGGANREILHDGENALVVEKLEAAEFTKAIERILRDTKLAETLSQNAHYDAAEYTWDERAKKIAGFIEHIMWGNAGELITW